MIAEQTLLGAESFRVEVSGWDENAAFFVEQSDLAWDDFSGKHISLQRMLPNGSVVFLRVLPANALGQFPPDAYRVEFVGSDLEGQNHFRLHPVHPRYNREPKPAN